MSRAANHLRWPVCVSTLNMPRVTVEIALVLLITAGAVYLFVRIGSEPIWWR